MKSRSLREKTMPRTGRATYGTYTAAMMRIGKRSEPAPMWMMPRSRPLVTEITDNEIANR